MSTASAVLAVVFVVAALTAPIALLKRIADDRAEERKKSGEASLIKFQALEKIDTLREKGVLSEEEYRVERDRLLGE